MAVLLAVTFYHMRLKYSYKVFFSFLLNHQPISISICIWVKHIWVIKYWTFVAKISPNRNINLMEILPHVWTGPWVEVMVVGSKRDVPSKQTSNQASKSGRWTGPLFWTSFSFLRKFLRNISRVRIKNGKWDDDDDTGGTNYGRSKKKDFIYRICTRLS